MKTILKTIVIFVFILMFSIQLVSNLEFFYKLNLDNYEINKSSILNVVNYLKGKEELNPQLFNEKEITHLKDVYNLLLISKILFVLTLLLLIILLTKNYLLKPSIYSFIFSLLLITLLLIIDFNIIFLKFHQLVFFNNFWILDPAKDLLINLFPKHFFIASFYSILSLFLVLHIISIFVFKVISRKITFK